MSKFNLLDLFSKGESKGMSRAEAPKRFVTITDEHGNVVHKGEDRRPQVDGKRKFFEVSAADVIKIIGILWLAVKFYFQTNADIQNLKSADANFTILIAEQQKITARMTEYMGNHDAWTSSVTGQRFQGGVPVNNNFGPATWRRDTVNNIRNSTSTPAQ